MRKGHIEIGAKRMGYFPTREAAHAGYDAVWEAAERLVEAFADGELLPKVPVQPFQDNLGRHWMQLARIMKLPVEVDGSGAVVGDPNCEGVVAALTRAAEEAGAKPGSCDFTCRLQVYE